MSKKKKIAIVIYLLMFPISITLATQIFAKYVGYAKGLGEPLFIINKTPFYPPFKIIEWQIYKNQAPIAFEKALTSGGITLVIFVFLIGVLTKKKHVETSHGAASFATQEDIKKMKLLPKEKDILKSYDKEGMTQIYKEAIYNNFPIKIANEDFKTNGIVIGQDEKGNYLYDNQPGHVILAAQTGAGKGVGFVLPTLWTWKESSIINDIKGENWQLTAGYRKLLGHKVLKFDATSLNTVHFNPMAEIRKGTVYEYQEAKNIADTIVSPDKKTDRFFGPNGVEFLTGVILHVLYMVKGRTANLTDVYRFLTTPTLTEEEKLEQMIWGEHNTTSDIGLFEKIYNDVIKEKNGTLRPDVHPMVSGIGNDMLNRADNERSGIISTAKTELAIFADPVISRAVQYSDFKIKDLMNYDVPVDLYFVTPPKAIGITATLMKLFINQIIFILTDEMVISDSGQNENFKHRLLLMIDEFPAIGKIELLHKALAYVRGYGMKVALITQDLKQLYDIYGENNSILNNCKTQIFYTPSDDKTTTFIEQKLGKKTVEQETKSWKGFKYFSDWNISTSYVGRSLMTFDEIQQLSDDESLIFITGQKPIHGKKIRWYKEERFKIKAKYKAPEKSDIIQEIR